MVNKMCSKCKSVKGVAEFNKKTASKDGLQPWCRSCQHGYPQARRKEIDGKFEVITLPFGVKCYKLRQEYIR